METLLCQEKDFTPAACNKLRRNFLMGSLLHVSGLLIIYKSHLTLPCQLHEIFRSRNETMELAANYLDRCMELPEPQSVTLACYFIASKINETEIARVEDIVEVERRRRSKLEMPTFITAKGVLDAEVAICTHLDFNFYPLLPRHLLEAITYDEVWQENCKERTNLFTLFSCTAVSSLEYPAFVVALAILDIASYRYLQEDRPVETLPFLPEALRKRAVDNRETVFECAQKLYNEFRQI